MAGTLLAGFIALAMSGHAAARIPPDARPVARTVLALFDSRDESTIEETRIHGLVEMPFNHLGYKLLYWDVNKPPPALPREDIAAVVTWFDQPVVASIALFERILDLTAGGARLIMFGESGEEDNWASAELAQKLFARIGLKRTGGSTEVTFDSRVEQQDSTIGTERPLVPPFAPFAHLVPASADLRVHLSLRDGPYAGIAVATGPGGGFVAPGYSTFFDPASDRMRWLLDPFAFLKFALGSPDHPIPDTTTLSGRRIYFSHIDGDGWNSLTEVDTYKRGYATAADVILGDIVENYPDLPVSAGLIAADTEPRMGGDRHASEAARKLYALPQVEIASHTYTHPFNWRFFEHYDRDRELALLARNNVGEAEGVMQTVARRMKQLADGSEDSEEDARKFIAYSDEFPRAYMRDPFDLETEIQGSLDVAQEHGPDGKKAALYLWSGETNPFEAALAATRAASVRNMNGGDSRLDWEWPSVAYVAPLSRPVGKQRQIYAVSSNENTYTNDWTGPFYGYATLSLTLANTETPRRLKPFNIYYHMYSGEKAASLAALKQLLDQARNSEVIPIHASHYAAIADDFFELRLAVGADGAWYAGNRGTVQTLRLDGAADRRIDMSGSEGVIGYRAVNRDLYIALDASVETARIVLADDDSDHRRPRLTSSRWLVRDVAARACRFEAKVQGFGRGEFVFDDLTPGTYAAELADTGEKIAIAADSAGRMQFVLNGPATEPRHLRVSCMEDMP